MSYVPRRDSALLFAAAFLVRMVALTVAAATGRFPEFWEYEVIARNVLGGRGFVYPFMGIDRWAYVEPLYPFIVTAVYAVTDYSVVALAVVQGLVSALLVPVTYAIARRLFGRPSAIAAGMLVAIHPALSAYATKFHPVTFDALAIALLTLATLVFLEDPRPRTAVVLGVAIGLGTLTRPTVLVFVAVLATWLILSRRRPAALPSVAIALLTSIAIVAPWMVRNYDRLDALVLTRSHIGFGFWLGNHPGATGGEGDPTDPAGDRSQFDRAPAEFRAEVLAQSNELAQDRVFRAAARQHVVADPGAFLHRILTRLGYFWWFPPYLGKRYAAGDVQVYRAFYGVVLVLAIAGLVARWQKKSVGSVDGFRVTVLMLATVSVAQSLFYVQGRHRVAVEALLITFSGHGIVRIRDAWRGAAGRGGHI